MPAAPRHLPHLFRPKPPIPNDHGLPASVLERLTGRYGAQTATLIALARPGELETIPGTRTLWAELRWALSREAVVHLDDLLLRRTRIGLQLPEGGLQFLPKIRALCLPILHWSEHHWMTEEDRYRKLWQSHDSPEPFAST